MPIPETNLMKNPTLKAGDSIDNEQLRSIFKVGMQGGMRRSHATNSLVIISDHTKGIYEDRWIGDIFHYTGMGLSGNQNLDFMQNRTLAESNRNGVKIHLFEVFEKGRYIYHGEVSLAGNPYKEKQPGADGLSRSVWIFPLKLKASSGIPIISDVIIQKKEQKQLEKLKKLPFEELEERAKQSREIASSRYVKAKMYERNQAVIEFAKKKAKGKCQLCGEPAPFFDKKKNPYLETHHINWLSNGGEDTIYNTIALCPNCHSKMHILDREEDKKTLLEKVKK